MRVILKRMTLLCMCAFLLGCAHLSYADDYMLVEALFSVPEGFSGLIHVPGKGEMRYYAQNDPLWALLCYEKADVSKRRPFRDSGCNPSAAAMAIAYLVPEGDIPKIAALAKRPYSLCACSLNQSRCIHNHTRYELTSQRDYVRFLPLIFGDYATGNNIYDRYSRSASAGTGTAYLHEIADLYSLKLTSTANLNDAVSAMNNGAAVIALASAGGAFTDTGHYVMLAHQDEDRLYILDPLYRTVYKTKYASSLEIIQPGLVAMPHEKVRNALFSTFYIFEKQ